MNRQSDSLGEEGNRRRFGRRETFKPAKLLLSSGQCIPCVVINMSEGGSLLHMRGAECNDNEFALFIEQDDIIVACEVAHRTADNIGVRYLRSPRRASRIGTKQHERARVIAKRAVGRQL